MARFTRTKDGLTVHLNGELDHCAAKRLRLEIESMILRNGSGHLTLDFSDVSFMDSSGVGMIIGRYKTMKARGGSMSAFGMNATVEKLYRMAGLHRIIAIEEPDSRKKATETVMTEEDMHA